MRPEGFLFFPWVIKQIKQLTTLPQDNKFYSVGVVEEREGEVLKHIKQKWGKQTS